jgi:hypothetical protein
MNTDELIHRELSEAIIGEIGGDSYPAKVVARSA